MAIPGPALMLACYWLSSPIDSVPGTAPLSRAMGGLSDDKSRARNPVSSDVAAVPQLTQGNGRVAAPRRIRGTHVVKMAAGFLVMGESQCTRQVLLAVCCWMTRVDQVMIDC